jgi:hypothetical protein
MNLTQLPQDLTNNMQNKVALNAHLIDVLGRIRYINPMGFDVNMNVRSGCISLYRAVGRTKANMPKIKDFDWPADESKVIEDECQIWVADDGVVTLNIMNTFQGHKTITDTTNLDKLQEWLEWVKQSPEQKY